MDLPFTKPQFFDVFAAYNRAVWPAQWVLAGLAIAMLAAVLLRPERAANFVAVGLAALWTWMAVGYHLAFFRAINPAAPAFAALFLATAAVFVFVGGVRGRLAFGRIDNARAASGWALMLYALLGYPAVGALAGHVYPYSPTFGLPCPTTLFTVGMLMLAAPGLPRLLVAGPLAWSLIGGTAAFALGVPQDYGLFVAAACCLWLLLPGRSARAPA